MAFAWNRAYTDPEVMRERLTAHFTDCDNRTKRVLSRNEMSIVTAPDPEPYTVAGFCLALEISKVTLLSYRDREGFKEVLDWAYTKMEQQWTALTARGSNNGGAMYYLGNIFKGEYVSQANINIGGQAGSPVQLNVKTERERLAACSYEELEKIETIMLEAEKRDPG